jgi:uncharacterized coiled-coil DUF342 family protein
MLTDEDIDKLAQVFVTKSEFQETVATLATRKELEEAIAGAVAGLATKDELKITTAGLSAKIEGLATKEDINRLMNAIDKYASNVETYHQEMTVLGHQVDRNAKHTKQIADHLDFKLEY